MILDGVSVCRLSYDRVAAYNFPSSGRVAKFTGSSLNVKKYENRKKKKNIEKTAAGVRSDADEVLCNESGTIYNVYRNDKIGKQGVKRTGKKTYSIGKSARRKIKNRGAAMWRVGRCRSIVTLSFIAPVTDSVAIKCLQNFIRSWRKEDKNINYLWVAERQENGNPHFHIVTSNFFDIDKENARWVRVQYNAGLVYTHEHNGVISRQEIEFLIKDGTLNLLLNPFDVKKISTCAGVISYLTKYMTKAVEKNGKKVMATFEFHPWRCSHRVSKVFTGVVVQAETMEYFLSDKNIRVQAKDYFKDGVLKYPRGYIHKTVPCRGMWATVINVYNESLAGGQYAEMDAVNKRILCKGEKPEIEFISKYDFYCLYCRPVTDQLVYDSQDAAGYYNAFADKKEEIVTISGKCFERSDLITPLPVPGVYNLGKRGYYDVGINGRGFLKNYERPEVFIPESWVPFTNESF